MAKSLLNRDIDLIVNCKSKGVTSLPVIGNIWFQHPSDPTADVAVIPFAMNPDLETVSVSTRHFIDASVLSTEQIGIGDEVFIVGLFAHAAGKTRNMPLVRHGNIAMIPTEQVQIESGYADVYLIEARSIGGLSGSPVFVRKTVSIKGKDNLGRDISFSGPASDFRLLGLMHGHWDINEFDINNPRWTHSQRGVNLGIGVVVPACKILETLNCPALVAARQRNEDAIRSSITPTQD